MSSFAMPRFFRAATAAAFAVALSACGTANVNYVTGQQQRGAYTWAQEVQIGREADPQISAQFGIYDDAELNTYVQRVAQSVLQTSAYTQETTPAEIRNTPFTFRVLDSDVVNAFALPGGFIYVTRGLLAHLDNEAQLAVVLGHEIGHVLGRHSSEQAARAQLGQLGVLGAAVLGQVVGGGRVAEGILNYGSTGAQLLLLRYGRDAERESDQAGVAYASFAGYDAAQGSRFFTSLRRLTAESGGGLPSFMSSHPDPGEREATIRQLAAQYPQATATNTADYLRAIDGIVIGENPRQGFTEGNTFHHPDLRFSFDYPAGWTVNNSAQAVTIVQPNQQGGIQFTLAQGTSAEAAARTFAGQQGLTVTQNRRVTIGGNPATRVEGTAQQQSGVVGFTATFIEYSGNVYQILGLAPQQTFNTHAGALRQTADSFRRLTDSRFLNRQPTRLDVVNTTGTTTLQQMLQGRALPEGLNPERMAIMNQVQLNESLPRGTALKLPAR